MKKAIDSVCTGLKLLRKRFDFINFHLKYVWETSNNYINKMTKFQNNLDSQQLEMN